MKALWLKLLTILLGAGALSPALAELRAFEVPPNFVLTYHKGDGPDPFPWGSLGPNTPPGSSTLNSGGDQNGDGWPDFDINALTKEGECAWSRNDSGRMKIAFSETHQGIWGPISQLTSPSADDLDPRITSSTTGGSKIVFWRNESASRIYLTERASPTEAWSSETLVSGGNDPAYYPSAVLAFGKVHVGYETDRSAGGKDIVISGRAENGSGAFQPEVITHTSFTGLPQLNGAPNKIGVSIETMGAKLWVSWVHSETQVGYSIFSGTSWGSVHLKGYSNPDDIEAVRFQIRRDVLGGAQ